MYFHYNSLINLAGLPPTIVLDKTSFITAEPAATIAFVPIRMPGKIAPSDPNTILNYNIFTCTLSR